MTDPPEPATDDHPEPPARPRNVVGPVDTFTRVDPVDPAPSPASEVDPVSVESAPMDVAPVDGPVVPQIISRDELDTLAAADGLSSTSTERPDPARAASAAGQVVAPIPSSAAHAGGGGGGPEAPRSSAWWRFGFPLVMVLLVVAIPSLVWVGSRVLLDSDDGRVVSAVTDPAAPGWEAVVDPTPVHTIAVTDADQNLDHIVLQFLTGSASGGVVIVPGDTVFDSGAYGDVPLTRIFTNGGGASGGGGDAIRGALESIVGIGIDEIQVVEPAAWAPLVSPVAPITVANPDDVTGTSAQGAPIAFPMGSLRMTAAEVWPYLSAENPGENAINRMVRVEAFWRGWLGAVTAAGDAPGSVPGEIDSGLGYFVRSLAKGSTQVETLPVASITGPAGEAWFDPQDDAVRELISTLDPFPAGPVGERLRLRILDGTGQLDHGLGAAKALAAAGGQVEKVGNALEFDHATTQFVFYDPALRPKVQALRDALGVGELVQSDELNVPEDVTVVLGQDYAAVAPPVSATVESGLDD